MVAFCPGKPLGKMLGRWLRHAKSLFQKGIMQGIMKRDSASKKGFGIKHFGENAFCGENVCIMPLRIPYLRQNARKIP